MIENWREAIVDLSYFATAILFIIGLKMLSNPNTALRGNRVAAVGMTIAVLATFLDPEVGNYLWIIAAIVIGAVVSTVAARRVKMTAMPQMVAIFNGMGAGTVALVSVAEFFTYGRADELNRGLALSIVLGTIIGSIACTGSVIAFAKLQELMSGRPIVYPSQQVINGAIAAAILVLGVLVVLQVEGALPALALVLVFVLALVLGALAVLPIGGADMPVVIAILNSMVGISAALTGLVVGNQALVIAGILVGASGSLLTLLMARAMNRSVANVLFGAFGAVTATTAGAARGEELPLREATPEDAAVPLAYAERVIIVPGYGLAVAQAQHTVRELADTLEERGVDVKYAIHPVAGRMPGHMNVLLAEANVPYDQLVEMDEINDDFANTDVALVIGANDVTNPAARSDPSSPIYGMPILNVDQAKNVYVLKRGKGTGFAGIENELFHNPKTSMLFGDAKESISKLIGAVKAA